MTSENIEKYDASVPLLNIDYVHFATTNNVVEKKILFFSSDWNVSFKNEFWCNSNVCSRRLSSQWHCFRSGLLQSQR